MNYVLMSYGSLLTEPRFEMTSMERTLTCKPHFVWLPFVIIVPQIVQIAQN